MNAITPTDLKNAQPAPRGAWDKAAPKAAQTSARYIMPWHRKGAKHQHVRKLEL